MHSLSRQASMYLVSAGSELRQSSASRSPSRPSRPALNVMQARLGDDVEGALAPLAYSLSLVLRVVLQQSQSELLVQSMRLRVDDAVLALDLGQVYCWTAVRQRLPSTPTRVD